MTEQRDNLDNYSALQIKLQLEAREEAQRKARKVPGYNPNPETIRRWRDWLATGPKGGPPSGVVLNMYCQKCKQVMRCLPDVCA